MLAEISLLCSPSYFYLGLLLSLSLSSLSCSILLLLLVVSSSCGILSWQGALMAGFDNLQGLEHSVYFRPCHRLLALTHYWIGQNLSQFLLLSQIDPWTPTGYYGVFSFLVLSEAPYFSLLPSAQMSIPCKWCCLVLAHLYFGVHGSTLPPGIVVNVIHEFLVLLKHKDN